MVDMRHVCKACSATAIFLVGFAQFFGKARVAVNSTLNKIERIVTLFVVETPLTSSGGKAWGKYLPVIFNYIRLPHATIRKLDFCKLLSF